MARGLPEAQPPARAALDARAASLYEVLRDLAARSLARERPGHTLQPTALVHEAWLRLARTEPEAWPDESRFLAACAQVLRQVLVDHARRSQAEKRGGALCRVTLDERAEEGGDALDLLVLEEALTRLSSQHARAARVVELRFFAGLAGEEAARVLGVSPRTVDAEWRFARAWLMRALGESDGGAR